MRPESLKNLNRIEFVITLACTGKCKHCSQGAHIASGSCIRHAAAVDVVHRLAEQYDMESLMTFGGEPLLYWETVCNISMRRRGKPIYPKGSSLRTVILQRISI